MTINAALTSVLPGAGSGTSSVFPGTVVKSSPLVVIPGQSGETIQPLLEENAEIEPRGAEADPPTSKDGDDGAEGDAAVPEIPKKSGPGTGSNCGFCRAGRSASSQRDSNASRSFGWRLGQLVSLIR